METPSFLQASTDDTVSLDFLSYLIHTNVYLSMQKRY